MSDQNITLRPDSPLNDPFKTFHACNWEEDYEHENGNYINTCIECKLPFKGHKRRVICKMCAGPNWEELAKNQAPPDNKCAHAGCWGEGEMVGFARCMVKKVMPLEKQISDQDKIATNRTVEDAIEQLKTMIVPTGMHSHDTTHSYNTAIHQSIKELEKLKR